MVQECILFLLVVIFAWIPLQYISQNTYGTVHCHLFQMQSLACFFFFFLNFYPSHGGRTSGIQFRKEHQDHRVRLFSSLYSFSPNGKHFLRLSERASLLVESFASSEALSKLKPLQATHSEGDAWSELHISNPLFSFSSHLSYALVFSHHPHFSLRLWHLHYLHASGSHDPASACRDQGEGIQAILPESPTVSGMCTSICGVS